MISELDKYHNKAGEILDEVLEDFYARTVPYTVPPNLQNTLTNILKNGSMKWSQVKWMRYSISSIQRHAFNNRSINLLKNGWDDTTPLVWNNIKTISSCSPPKWMHRFNASLKRQLNTFSHIVHRQDRLSSRLDQWKTCKQTHPHAYRH